MGLSTVFKLQHRSLEDKGLSRFSIQAVLKPVRSLRRFRLNLGWLGRMQISKQELSQLFQQLGVMLETGLGLERGLEILAKQATHPPLSEALGEILRQIRSGVSLHEAVASRPRIFPGMVVQMIRVGEVGGVLTVMCYSISEHLEHEYEISNKVLTALAYPAIVLLFALAALLGISIYIMPMFAEFYASSQVSLPYLSLLVIKSSYFIKDYGLFGAFIVLLVVALLSYRARRSPRFSLRIHRGLLYAPLVGTILPARERLRLTGILAVLLQAGVPLLSALETAGQAARNRYFTLIVADVCANMNRGFGMAHSLGQHRQFNEMFVRMVAAAEETGYLPETLVALQGHLHKDLLHRLDRLIALLEPALIILVALLVGTMVIATLLPMYSLMDM